SMIRTLRYPTKKDSLYPFDGDSREVPPDEAAVWTECYEVARGYCSVSLEVHLGLDWQQERQLFHDLNRLGKRVDTNLALEFDDSNPVNNYIKQSLIGGRVRLIGDDERADSVADWTQDPGGLTRKELVAVNAHLFMNKSNINGATPVAVDERRPMAERFWD